MRRVAFWLSGSQLLNGEAVRVIAQEAFPHLDCSPEQFRCEQRPDDNQPYQRKPIPVDWYLWGTNRMRAEIDAGLRPFSDTIQPPIPIPKRPPTSLWKKLSAGY
jgi:hypothetical protein